MRLALVLSVLAAGCSASPAPSTDLLVAPEVVVEPSLVEEPEDLTIRTRQPIEALKPDLPEHPGEPEVADLPEAPPAPEGSFLAWLKDFYDSTPPIEPVVPAGVCQCGDSCECDDCQCANYPHRTVKESSQVRFVLLSNPSCIHCPKAKASADESGVEVEIIESDEAWELAREAGALRDFQDGHGLVPALPAWVAYVDDVPVKAWVGPSNAAGVRMMREFADGAAEGDPGAQDAQRHEAAKPGDPPAWCVRIHATVRTADGNSAFGTGSGAVVGRNLVLTNHHVASSAGRYRVKVAGEWREARRVSSDPGRDLALLSVDTGGSDAVPVAKSVSGGDRVVTHGYASGVVYRSQETVYRVGGSQHGASVDARSCGGESGGPVVNASGELVGLIYGADVEDDPDGGRGLIVSLDNIQYFLKRQGVL